MANIDNSAVVTLPSPNQPAQAFRKDGQGLYYSKTIAASTTSGTSISFFDTQSSDHFVTNVQLGNSLSTPDQFILKGFAFDVFTTTLADLQSFYGAPGVLPTLFAFFLNTSSKILFEDSLKLIPSQGGFTGISSTSPNIPIAVQSGVPTPRTFYPFRRGNEYVTLLPQQVFGVTVSIKTAFTTTTALTLTCHLVGTLVSGIVN